MAKPDDDIWVGDVLDRKSDARFIIDFLLGRMAERERVGKPKSYVLNIDAGWGEGKTFFLERLAKELSDGGNLVCTVNAWEDDHADDSLIAVMSAIDEVIEPRVKTDKELACIWENVRANAEQLAVALLKGMLVHWGRKVVGDAVDDIQKIAVADPNASLSQDAANATGEQIERAFADQPVSLLSSFRDARDRINSFRSNVEDVVAALVKEEDRKLFVLIDELDRCRPTYAISLLERVKHLFELDNVAFILATDTDQLCHSIGAVYGSGFDSRRYLHRFFDRSYSFNPPSLKQFIEADIAAHGMTFEKVATPGAHEEPPVNFLTDGFTYFECSLRDVQQCMDT